jgi:hypothetical protein
MRAIWGIDRAIGVCQIALALRRREGQPRPAKVAHLRDLRQTRIRLLH